jgi:hypothetical protein
MSPEQAKVLAVVADQVDKMVESLEQIVVSLFDLGQEDIAREFATILTQTREANEKLIVRLREFQKVGLA